MIHEKTCVAENFTVANPNPSLGGWGVWKCNRAQSLRRRNKSKVLYYFCHCDLEIFLNSSDGFLSEICFLSCFSVLNLIANFCCLMIANKYIHTYIYNVIYFFNESCRPETARWWNWKIETEQFWNWNWNWTKLKLNILVGYFNVCLLRISWIYIISDTSDDNNYLNLCKRFWDGWHIRDRPQITFVMANIFNLLSDPFHPPCYNPKQN